jgi:hypothetical protein
LKNYDKSSKVDSLSVLAGIFATNAASEDEGEGQNETE